MKIGFDAKRLYNNFTGLGNYSRALVQNLATYYPDNQYLLYTTKVKKHPSTLPFLDESRFQTIRPNLPLPAALWRSFGIKNDLKKAKLDIYHGLSHELPVGIQKTGIKSVVTIHDLIFKHYPDFFPLIDRKIYDWKFRYSCEVADAVIAISESTKQDIINFYGIPAEKIHVIYQTVDQQFWNQNLSEADFTAFRQKHQLPEQYLLYVGSIIDRKNLLNIVKALQQIPEKDRLPLVAVGDGKAYKQKVMDYIQQQQLEKWIHFRKIPFQDFPLLYGAAKINIYPSFYEGFGLPVLEALLCGTPVITSKVSSLPEAGGKAAYYVNPSNSNEIATAIQKIRTNVDLQGTMVEQGYAHAQRFTSFTVTKEVEALYRRIRT